MGGLVSRSSSKTNFGVTDFAEKVNFRRALEGELERSVMALSEVEQARVHISFPQESVYVDKREPAKASVLVKLRAELPDTAIPAITHLISSAVEGLSPDAVAVLDMRGNLLSKPKRPAEQRRGHISNRIGVPSCGGTRPHRQTGIDTRASGGCGQIPRRGLRRHGFDQRRTERGKFRPDPFRHGRFAKNRGLEYIRACGHRRSRNGFQPARPTRASHRERTGEFAQIREHQLPDQPGSEADGAPASSTIKAPPSISVSIEPRGRISGKSAPPQARLSLPPTRRRIKVIHDLQRGGDKCSEPRGDQLSLMESLPFESTQNLEKVEDLSKPTSTAPIPSAVEQLKRIPNCCTVEELAGDHGFSSKESSFSYAA